MKRVGSVISFQVHGGLEAAYRFANSLRLIPIATSYGGVETTIELPMQSKLNDSLSPKANLLRLSVGLENVEDLLEDLSGAFQAVPQVAHADSMID